MDNLTELVKAIPFVGWMAIGLVAYAVCQTIFSIRKMQIKHEERLARINAGQQVADEDAAYASDKLVI